MNKASEINEQFDKISQSKGPIKNWQFPNIHQYCGEFQVSVNAKDVTEAYRMANRIAAMDEMYGALKDIIECSTNNPISYDGLVRIAKAAISKAEGK
jgi:hypothetical protein